jgi:MFS family permease
MTNVSPVPDKEVPPKLDKERAWVEDHQRHHHRGEVINAATPSTSELPASIMTSGITGHEHVEPEYDVDIPPPTQPVTRKFIVSFAFAQLALFIALLGPVTVSMAIKVTRVVGEDRAPQAQGVILGIGAIAALLGNPLFGRLSDRTMSRWGRRRPWIVGGAIGLAVCLFVISIANNVPILIVAWFVAQLAANACFGAYLATIADQVPPQQSATITALGGVMQNVGILAALYLASALTGNMIALFMVPAAIGVVGMLIYALVLPDKRLRRRPPGISLGEFARTFWVSPRQHPDFAWAWISRFMLILGSFLFSTFRFFWMKDHLGLTDAKAVSVITTGVLIYTAVLVVIGQAAGYISDRLGRRKFLVFLSTALFAVGLGLLTQVHSISGFYLVEGILGAAYGIYMGVDLALVLAVLPHPEDNAKDLGVFNIANAMPQTLAPFLGAILLTVGAGKNYTLLYLTAAALTFLGAVAIIPVKKVK